MNGRLRKYLAEIGSRGGRNSRRELSADAARAMVRAREARRAIRRVAEQDRQRLRELSADQKIGLMNALWRQAWELAAAGVRSRQPQWDEERVREAVRQLLSRGAGD